MMEYDIIIRNGTIYDGSGSAPYRGDVAIQGDTIAAIGDLSSARGKREIDAHGLAVAPGFINMLSWSVESLIEDGRSQSEIRQGVTLEVMGEGTSMGPYSEAMKARGTRGILGNSHIQYDIEWTTLGEYLEWLERRGVSTNIASFVGTGTLREYVMGHDDREPTHEELNQMRELVRQAMTEGAMGLSAALIYPPATYAKQDELVWLAQEAAVYNGMYISHIRSEGSAFLDALKEFITITNDSGVTAAEIYHLKTAGEANWHLMDEAIRKIEEARARELPITADMYTYPYSGTGLSSCIPPWAHEGGHQKLIERLKDSGTRTRIKREMNRNSDEWENLYLMHGPEKILLSGFQTEALKPLTGKTLAEAASMRGASPEDTLMDLIVEDDSRIFTIYFSMSEDNLRKQVVLPWLSFCSDAESQAPEGVFLKTNPHPRAYGAFARVLSKYVREEKLISLEEAIRRLTTLPATNLKLDRRGALKESYFADVVVFDADKIQDHATPENPHQYATGIKHVFVNGVQVLADGEHTGAKPGRFVRGPGYGLKPFEALYPRELHPLFTLGRDYDGTYVEFNITERSIPDLIRIVQDARIHFYNPGQPQWYATIHAIRLLGDLRAQEAIEPLVRMQLMAMLNLSLAYEIPQALAQIGPNAIPLLVQRLNYEDQLPVTRISAAMTLRLISQEWPDSYALVEGVLIACLQHFRENDEVLNTALVNGLKNMRSQTAINLIAEVYAAGAVNKRIIGSWKAMQAELGIPKSLRDPDDDDEEDEDEDEFEDDWFDFGYDDSPGPLVHGPSTSSRDAAKKKKAKRKQTARMKKLQRKKKKR